MIQMPSTRNEVFWYCDGTRERSANDQAFNFVACERAGNGAIVFTFYKKQ